MSYGSTVTLILSLGPNQTPVPSLIGMTENQARQALQDANLKAKIGDPVVLPYGNSQDGKVMLQSPIAGTPALPGTIVTIRLGQASTTPPSSSTTTSSTTTTTTSPPGP